MVALAAACKRGARQSGAARDQAGPAPVKGPVALAERVLRATVPLPRVPAAQPGQRGGVLRVHLEAEPAQLNPLLDDDATLLRVTDRLIFEPLFDCASPEPFAPTPLLAEAEPVYVDGAEPSVVLRLRKGVRFHDGRRLTPVDVQASLESVVRQTAPRPLLRQLLIDVVAVEIRGDYSVHLRLARPSRLLSRALCEIPILPESALRGTASERALAARQPVGTGPFHLAGWERGRRIRLTRYDEYHGQHAWLDGIDFEIDTDGARALTRLKRGRLDVLPRVLEVHFPDQIESVVRTGAQVVYRLAPEHLAFLAVNTRIDPLSDSRFRRALSLLWDRRRMAGELRKGLARPQVGPILGDESEAPPNGGAQGPGAAGFDRIQAVALLEQAGYTDSNDDGVRDRGGRPIRLRMVHTTGNKILAREVHLYSLELRRAGLLLDLLPVEPAAFLARIEAGDFDLAPLAWEGRAFEDPRLLYGANSPFNVDGYRSAHLDALIDDLVLGRVEPRTALVRVHDFVATELPIVFLYRHDTLALVGRQVRGLAGQGSFLDLRWAWLEAP